MPGVPQPPDDSYTNPDGSVRDPSPDDPPQTGGLDPSVRMTFKFRDRAGIAKCKPEQAVRNLQEAVEEIYNNLLNIYQYPPQPLVVRDDAGDVTVIDVKDIVASCMNVEELSQNSARLTPKVSEIFKAPPAGIAVCNSTTIPSGTCTKCEIQSGVLVTTSDTATVYNLGAAITGDSIIVAHKVYGCIYVTAGCCENTVISPTGSGSGGSTDPPSQGDCDAAQASTTNYQYDIELNGIFELNPLSYANWNLNGEANNCCHGCELLRDGDPYTIRVTNSQDPFMGFIGYDNGVPGGVGSDLVTCIWKGSDYASPEIDPDAPGTPPGQCGRISCDMGLVEIDPTIVSWGNFWAKVGTLVPDATPDDYGGIYLWVVFYWDDNGYEQNLYYSYPFQFVKRLSDDVGTLPSMNLSSYEIDITPEAFYTLFKRDPELVYAEPWANSICPTCWPKAWANDEANQGRTYVSISRVTTGGLLSV